MREFKFRAWDGKSMMDVPVNHSGYRLNELLEGICDNYELMQYTGLHDSTSWYKATPQQRRGYTEETWKGVEIYEGDILSWYEIGGHYMTEVVSWEVTTHGFYPVNSWRPSQSIVIGNIQENRELLDGK